MPVTSEKLERLYGLSHKELFLLTSYLARDLSVDELQVLIEDVRFGAESDDYYDGSAAADGV